MGYAGFERIPYHFRVIALTDEVKPGEKQSGSRNEHERNRTGRSL